jgi:hypothetical protein
MAQTFGLIGVFKTLSELILKARVVRVPCQQPTTYGRRRERGNRSRQQGLDRQPPAGDGDQKQEDRRSHSQVR